MVLVSTKQSGENLQKERARRIIFSPNLSAEKRHFLHHYQQKKRLHICNRFFCFTPRSRLLVVLDTLSAIVVAEDGVYHLVLIVIVGTRRREYHKNTQLLVIPRGIYGN